MSQGIKQLILYGLLVLSLFSSAARAEGIKIQSAELERVDNDWL
jgi:hypothetical protein